MSASAGTVGARATLDNTEFLGALKEMTQQMQSQFAAASEAASGITQTLGHVGEAVAGLEIADKIKDFVAECIDAAAQVGKLHAAFVALNGATAETEETFAAIKELGLHSMFDFETVLGPAAKQMMLLGVSAEDTKNVMVALVDEASMLKMGPEWIGSVTGALDNMEAHLVVSKRDMRALTQQGIDGWGDLVRATGKTIDQVQRDVAQGTITANQVVQAVTADLKAQSEGSAETVKNTWKGAMHELGAAGEEAKESIGKGILATLNDFAPILNSLNALLTGFTKFWTGLPQPVKDAALAIGLAVVAVGALTTAIPLLKDAWEAMEFAFSASTTGWIIAVVAALALLGKWVYDNWPAIKAVFLALWDDIVAKWNSTWAAVKQWFDTNFGGLASVLTSVWGGVKTAVGGVINFLAPLIQQLVGWVSGAATSIGNFFKSIPGAGEIGKLTGVWNQAQAQMAATAAAVKKHNDELEASHTAIAKNIQDQKLKDQTDLAASNQAAASAKAASAAAAQAKKDADELKAKNDSLKATYDALNKVAPDVAGQFASLYGGVSTDAEKAQKVVGKAWDDLDASTQTLITNTIALGAAYSTLGVTSVASLEGAQAAAVNAYTTISESGKATAGDLASAFDAVVAASQKVADKQNTDVKDAYDQGKITASDYYDTVIARAQDMVDKTKADYEAGLTTEQDVAAQEKLLLDDRTKAFNKQRDDYNAAMAAIGEKTEEQLSAATEQWRKYGDVIAAKTGTDTKPYIEAHIALIKSVIDQYKLLGQPIPDSLTASLKTAQTQLENLQTPAEKFTAAMKALGVDQTGKAVAGLETMAQALTTAKANADGTAQSTADLATGQTNLETAIGKLVDTYNNKWQVALKAGDITQSQYLQHAKESAQQVQMQFSSLGDDTPGKIALVTASANVLSQKLVDMHDNSLSNLQKSFHDLGVNTPAAMDNLKTTTVADLQAIATEVGTDSGTYQMAYINATKKIYDAMTTEGTSLSSAQKEDLGKMEVARSTFITNQASAWSSAYTTLSGDLKTAFDGMTTNLITGKGSFGDVAKKLWQDLATAALDVFLNPLKTAITKFISTELANLLGDKGLGGVLSSLTKIGTQSSTLFNSAAKTGVSSIPTPGLPKFGGGGSGEAGSEGSGLSGLSDVSSAGDFGGEAGGGASSAAGSIAGSLGSMVSIVGAAGAVVGAVSGIISNFQNARQETTLNAIESNTRKAELYLGDRADGGILGVLFHMYESMSVGETARAIQNLRDLFLDWKTPMLDHTHAIRTMLEGWGPYVTDIRDALFDLRTIAGDIRTAAITLGQSVNKGFGDLQVTINAGNLTTAAAAKQLGDQIAANLSTQLVSVK